MQRPNPIENLKNFISFKKKPTIAEIVREPTAGGVVYRVTNKGQIEILLIQDAKNRWTIPKGHIEPGETPRQTAEREINEETGVKNMQVGKFLGRINFRYRRMQSLVLMTTDVFLVKAMGDSSSVTKEEWMNGIKWMSASQAYDLIEYEDIGKLILLALKVIRSNGSKTIQ
jgi:ADP-ribose pyrophosphatase YjhB (NUDIX family)